MLKNLTYYFLFDVNFTASIKKRYFLVLTDYNFVTNLKNYDYIKKDLTLNNFFNHVHKNDFNLKHKGLLTIELTFTELSFFNHLIDTYIKNKNTRNADKFNSIINALDDYGSEIKSYNYL